MAYMVLLTEQEIEHAEVQSILNQAGNVPVCSLHYIPASCERVDDEELVKAISVMHGWPFPKKLSKVTGQTPKAKSWCLWIANT